ncbi:MAG TPA: glycosyltransferase family 4 protein [Gaiellaceae bacterium]
MRLLVATDQWSPDAIGGSARVATATAVHLARAGHDVVVVSPFEPHLLEQESVDGVSLHRAIRRRRVPQSFADVIETWRFARRQPRPDLLISHQATGAVGLSLAHPDVPLLHVFHASAPLEERFIRRQLGGAARLKRTLLAPVLIALERRTLRHARAIAVLSDYSARLVVERDPRTASRIVRVRGGLDFERFASGDRARGRELADVADEQPLVLTVRRLEPRMGIEDLIRAAGLLAARGIAFRVAIAGTGALRGILERLAAELGLERDVRFLGRVAEEDLPDLYAGADLFVLPTVAYEGFGISTAEALAAGTPVVGTPVGATPELLEPLDDRLVAAGTSPEQLADAIAMALRQQMGPVASARAREYARVQFAWEEAIVPWLSAVAAAAES